MFTIIATIDVGMKNIKFVACAICCSSPHKTVSKNIRIVPPPIPVPLIVPEIIPINTSTIFPPFYLFSNASLIILSAIIVRRLSHFNI